MIVSLEDESVGDDWRPGPGWFVYSYDCGHAGVGIAPKVARSPRVWPVLVSNVGIDLYDLSPFIKLNQDERGTRMVPS